MAAPSYYKHDEEEYFVRTVHTFKNYQDDSMNRHSYQQKAFSEASLKHKELLLKSGFGQYLEDLLNCVEANQSVLSDIVATAESQMGPSRQGSSKPTYKLDQDRLNDMLAQIVREWTLEGEEERATSFGLILEELHKRFPDEKQRSEVKVFVPGSALARLPFEIAQMGFDCIGNEQNLFLLFTASFILNQCKRTDNYRIYPWLHDLTNRPSMDAVTTPIAFPDIDPSKRIGNFKLSMLPGDFVEVCQQSFDKDSLDAVVTSFFLDSAHNVLEYVQLIHRQLKPGGVWINLGGLNYAYDKYESEISVQLPLDVVKEVIKETGFKFVRDEQVWCQYCSHKKSMTVTEIHCMFFVCEKATLP